LLDSFAAWAGDSTLPKTAIGVIKSDTDSVFISTVDKSLRDGKPMNLPYTLLVNLLRCELWQFTARDISLVFICS
jgi:hypothetical protein